MYWWICRYELHAREFSVSFVCLCVYFCVLPSFRTFRYSIFEMLNLGIYLARKSHMRLHGYLFVCCVCCLFVVLCIFVLSGSQSVRQANAAMHPIILLMVDMIIPLDLRTRKKQNVWESLVFSFVHSTADWTFFLLVFLLLLFFFAQWEHARTHITSHCHRYRYKLLLVLLLIFCLYTQ